MAATLEGSPYLGVVRAVLVDNEGKATWPLLHLFQVWDARITTALNPSFAGISGQITTAQLPAAGLTVTIVTAALTPGGTQGSMTFTNGILTAFIAAT